MILRSQSSDGDGCSIVTQVHKVSTFLYLIVSSKTKRNAGKRFFI